jgi:P4 family phage/plasmid primase-like protien
LQLYANLGILGGVMHSSKGKWKLIISELIPEFSEALDKAGTHVPCPIHGGKDGFRFYKDFEETGGGVCNTCGYFPNGFKLIAWAKNCSLQEARAMVKKFLAKKSSRTRAKAKKIKIKSHKMPITISKKESTLYRSITKGFKKDSEGVISKYLKSRNLKVPVPSCVRFHPKLSLYGENRKFGDSFPAMVFPISKNGEPIGLHITYLAPDGSNKAPVPNPKITIKRWDNKSLSGGSIALMEYDGTERLILAEGVETALACYQATGWVTWACGNTSLMKNVNIPNEVNQVYTACDLDELNAGVKAAEFLGERMMSVDKEVFLVVPAGPIPKEKKSLDWLDVLNECGAKAVNTAFCTAKPWEPDEAKNISINLTTKATPFQLVECLIERYNQKIIHVNGNFFNFHQGYWKKIDDGEIKKQLSKLDGANTSDSRIKSPFIVLKTRCWQEDPDPQINLIGLINGDFDPIKENLLPHCPEHRIFNQLPIEWRSQEECPLWKQTLNEIFEQDEDSKQKLELLQEWFGYCLIPETKFHKFLWLVGPGANGKSVILDVLSSVVGNANVSYSFLNSLHKGHIRAGLYCKLLNISYEMNIKSAAVDEYLKAIVSGDMIEGDKKYAPSFFFRPYVRLVSASNELPPSKDLSHGFLRRPIILMFNRIFNESEQDKNLKEKLLKELPGIFVWAVKGLKRLLKNDQFTIPFSSKEALTKHIIDSDPIRQFVEEELEYVHRGRLLPPQIYIRYMSWASRGGYGDITKNNLGRRLTELGHTKWKTNGKEFWELKFKNENTE